MRSARLMLPALHSLITLPKPVALRTLELLSSLDRASFRDPLVGHLASLPSSVPLSVRQRLEVEAKTILESSLEPALQAFVTFFKDTYLAGCRTTLGASTLPDGRTWYERQIRLYTTTEETPETIHTFGLEELKRLRAEMMDALQASGFKGDLQAFGRHLDQDPSYRYPSGEALLVACRAFAKRVDGALPRILSHLPRTPFGIEAMPTPLAKTMGRGYSRPGNLRTGMAGQVHLNTHKLNTHRTWGLPAFILHEAAPGHQTQMALRLEDDELPVFRQQLSIGAFSEGWALYCEGLGEDLGLASDATDRFGRARAESFRAARLVVDTGLHTQGWSRDRAVAFLVQEAFLTQDHAEMEVDRYLALPGQALSYQMGLGTFRRLRREAEAALGARFDLRAFHDALLEAGPLPMHILDARVRSRLRLPAKGSPKCIERSHPLEKPR